MSKAIDIVKTICDQQAEELGRLEFEETKIGRLDHKIAKLQVIKTVPGDRVPQDRCCHSGERRTDRSRNTHPLA